MYVRVDGLGQPSGPTPQPVTPGPPLVPMPNPLAPAPAPSPPPIRIVVVRSLVQCSEAQLAEIRKVVGPGITVTGDTVRLALAKVHNGIWFDLVDREAAPRSELLKSLRSATTIQQFTDAFGAGAPPDRKPWHGAKWDLGRIVAARLGGAGKTMFSSSLRISCWGWPWPGGGADRPAGYMVKALPNRERVALGALFWQSWAKGDAVSPAAALLAAGLVIRYGVSYSLLAPPLRNLHCYLKYAISALGHPVPQWVDAKCAQQI